MNKDSKAEEYQDRTTMMQSTATVSTESRSKTKIQQDWQQRRAAVRQRGRATMRM